MSEVQNSKRCGRCKEEKSLDCFGVVKGKVRSYCRTCHNAQMNTEDLRTEKKCPKCRETKPVTEFNRIGKRFQSQCRPCQQEYSRLKKEEYRQSGHADIYWRGYYEEVRRWQSLLRKHGITKEEYERLEKKQGGLCAICRKKESEIYRGTLLRLAVDHDHKTGKVRGLLCRACNLAIGKFGEDLETLKRAVAYLEASIEST